MKIVVELSCRDKIEIETIGEAQAPKIRAIGCPALLELLKTYQKNNGSDFRSWPMPAGTSHQELLLKEALLKVKGEWKFPYGHDELCHCRSVAAALVDQAIVAGAHTTAQVSRQTTASTSCGTCRPDVQQIIDYRLNRPA